MNTLNSLKLLTLLFVLQPISLLAITFDPASIDESTIESTTENFVKADLQQRTTQGLLITSVGNYKTIGVEVTDNRPASQRYRSNADAKVVLVFALQEHPLL